MSEKKPVTEFLAEATEIVEGLSRELVVLDEHRGEEPEPDRLNSIFRAAHSLKGLSSLFGHERITRLAHVLEDALDALRLGKVMADDALIDAFVDAVDALSGLLTMASRDESEGPAAERAVALAQHIESLLSQGPTPVEDPLKQLGLEPSVLHVLTEYEEHRLRENVKKGVTLYKVRAVFSLDDFDQRLTALTAALKAIAEVVSTLPSAQASDESHIGFDLLTACKQSAAELTRVLAPYGASHALISASTAPPRPRPSAPRPELGSSSELSLRSLAQTVRVDISRLDKLMAAVGDLLLTRSNIKRFAEGARAAGPGGLHPLWAQELAREARALERKLDDLQKGILEVRMVPLGQVFDRLARLVRRLLRESGKEIDFEISGGDVELDKLIVEDLSDPLMHLLRNAIDHGIETPEQRVAAGKSRRGRVRLYATSEGNHVKIEVGDDGAGLDEARIRDEALKRGLVTATKAPQMQRRELLNLVFLPGFSTRKQVSELSGRGVGLDVVKTNLQRLSGLIDIVSEPGQGTTFVLTLPLTLAIIRALVVQASGHTYAVPLNSVLEIVAVRPSELRTVEHRQMLSVRGQTVPFVRLSQLFKLPLVEVQQHYVVLVGLAQHRMGLAVDALLGQQDVVTKPLSARLRDVRGFAGATDLGDRRAVLVLDVPALVSEMMRPADAGMGNL
ncbi:MAG: chemotaxis protein CheA [Archangiaceae bacterium]|nr:chemotaxis protein CheA [Archangiaceae bacterium]